MKYSSIKATRLPG